MGLSGVLGGVGNIGDDPLLVDPGSANYRPSAGSPAIDAGDNTAVPTDTIDLDGDADTAERTPIDLGPFEFSAPLYAGTMHRAATITPALSTAA